MNKSLTIAIIAMTALLAFMITAIVVSVAGADPSTKSNSQPTTSTDTGSGFGLSYNGKVGIDLGNGLVVTGSGVQPGIGF